MKFIAAKRDAGNKSEIKKSRREGKIPAILYSKGEKGTEIVIDGIEFQKILNTTPTGTLSSKVFTLEIEGKAHRAILKDIQYEVTSYRVLHLDFEELHEDLPVTLNIPIRCINTAFCAGVKLGGVVRQVNRYLRVTCLPKDIPSHFDADVQELAIGQSLRLSALQIPANVRPVTDLKEVAVVIARK